MSNTSPPEAPVYSQEMADAWWLSRHGGLIRKAARDRPGRPSMLIPRPLAAYRIGVLSRSIRVRIKTLWERPRDRSTWVGVHQATSQLNEARRVLPPEIDGWFYEESPRLLNHFNRLTADLIQAARAAGQYNGARFGTGPVPGIELWQQLRTLADEALNKGSPLRPYYELGVALGDYQLALWDLDPAAVMSDDPGLFPDILPVVGRARQLPEDELWRIPLLWAMVRSAPELNSGEQAAFSSRLIAENRDAFRLRGRAVGFRTINELARTLDTRIQEGLQRIASEPAQSGPDPQLGKPSWREDLLELYVRDRCVRRVAKQAHCLIVILNKFENEGWPLIPIANPLPTCPDADHLSDTLKTLNAGLSLIHFRGNGNGRGITWGWNPILNCRDAWTR